MRLEILPGTDHDNVLALQIGISEMPLKRRSLGTSIKSNSKRTRSVYESRKNERSRSLLSSPLRSRNCHHYHMDTSQGKAKEQFQNSKGGLDGEYY